MRVTKKRVWSTVFITLIVTFASLYYYANQECRSLANFRSTSDIAAISGTVDTTGLENLRISGSSAPIFSILKQKLQHIKGDIYIIDLIGEKSTDELTYFRNDYPIDFLDGGESTRKSIISKIGPVIIGTMRQLCVGHYLNKADTDQLSSEEVAATSHGFHYIKLAQHRRELPDNTMIDKLIDLVETLPKDAWLHLHCRGGKGRTTSIMAMIDILKNGKNVPLETIVKRHHLMNGQDLFDTTPWTRGTYKKEKLQIRKKFIEAFYAYINDPKGYKATSWKQWCQKNSYNFPDRQSLSYLF